MWGSGSERASYYGRTVDALASGADEGRGIAAISLGERPITRDHPGIPEWGNPPGYAWYPRKREASGGTETSKYPEEQRLFPE